MVLTDCFRAKVPGGWLVMLKWGWFLSHPRCITFYPDHEHKWDGGSLPAFGR